MNKQIINLVSNIFFKKRFFKNTFFITFISILLIQSSFSFDYWAAGKKSFKKNDYEKASYYFSKALQKFPGNNECRYYYAQTLINLKKFKKAQKEYEKIIETAPMSQEAKLAVIGISKIQKLKLAKKGQLDVKKKKDSYERKVNVKTIGVNYISRAIDGGKVTRWHSEKMPVSVYIEKPAEEAGAKDYYYNTALKAINDWIKKVPGNLLSYKIVDQPDQADIRLYFTKKIMTKQGDRFIAGLATPYVKEHLLYYYDIKIVTQKPPDNRPFTEKEIYRTFLHEFGHALGIRGHSRNENDIMYAAVETNPKHSDEGLTERDINTLTLLYTLDPDISNFDRGEIPIKNSNKNEKILGSKKERLEKKLEEAIEYTEKYPDNVLSWIQLGKTYKDLEYYDMAIKSLNKALTLDSGNLNAIEHLAFVYRETGDFEKAKENFEKLIRLHPEETSYSYNYAVYLVENHKYQQSKNVLYKLISVNPKAYSNSDVKTLLDYLNNQN